MASVERALGRMEKHPVFAVRDIVKMFAVLQADTREAMFLVKTERRRRHEVEQQMAWIQGVVKSLTELDAVKLTPKRVRDIVWQIQHSVPNFSRLE